MELTKEQFGLISGYLPRQRGNECGGCRSKFYRQRNEIERYFLRLKRFRRIFTRYDKLDSVFSGFIFFAMAIDSVI